MPEMKEVAKTLAINEKELYEYFEPGNHVKVLSGTQEGATGMVVKVEQHVLIILSDVTKEHIRVFADDVVESSEVTYSITRIRAYEDPMFSRGRNINRGGRGHDGLVGTRAKVRQGAYKSRVEELLYT
ncbi:hypothetical protein GBA52_013109 [Prunus armeniaca]|nr:hypothetical protein GBA52_013109 [Prunus armeniaca]